MSEPYYSDEHVTLWHGDCLDVLQNLPAGSVDAVVTDPPYGLEFMGRKWDGDAGFLESLSATGRGARVATERAGELTERGSGHSTSAGPYLAARVAGRPFQDWCHAWATECLRVLKPGGHLLAFGGTRTWHRLACAIEDAGFEIRDSIAWLYGSGFPKSLDVSKAIDKAAGVEREVVPNPRAAQQTASKGRGETIHVEGGDFRHLTHITPNPATDTAQQWQGWGSAMKPAFEPVVVARKPLIGTIAQNVLTYGTGALNIDACRINPGEAVPGGGGFKGGAASRHEGWTRPSHAGGYSTENHNLGRWPTNVVLDDTQADELDGQSGVSTSRVGKPRGSDAGDGWGMTATGAEYADAGGASRFFPTFRYEAKASRSERPRVNGTAHPTVKPIDLMRWLVRLVTPPGGTVLEPFAGSGTTVEACIIEGFRCIAIERETDYLPLIEQRIHRRRDPVAAIRLAGDDLGLFDSDARRLSQGVLDFGEGAS